MRYQNNQPNQQPNQQPNGRKKKNWIMKVFAALAVGITTTVSSNYFSRIWTEFVINPLRALDQVPFSKLNLKQDEKYCESTSVESAYSAQYNLVFAPEHVIRDNQKYFESILSNRDKKFDGNALHMNLMNHYYDTTLNILKTFPQQRDLLLNAKDKNGRTPLHLALEIGAPKEFISQLLTAENVVISDKDGITPIMLGARGSVDGRLMQQMIEMIPQDKRESVLQQKDVQGRAAQDWNKMSKDELIGRLKEFRVDGKRDEKYCTGGLFYAHQHSYLSAPTSSGAKEVIEKAGLEVGITYRLDGEYPSIAATKENVEKLRRYATDETKEAKAARELLSDFWWKSSDGKSDFWKSVADEMNSIESSLSGVSIVDSFLQNQADLSKLISGGIKVREVTQVSRKKTKEREVDPYNF